MARISAEGAPLPDDARKPISRPPWMNRRVGIVAGAAATGVLAVMAIIGVRGRGEPTPDANTQSHNVTTSSPIDKPDSQLSNSTDANRIAAEREEYSKKAILNITLQSLDGKERTVKDYADQKPVVLVLWSILDGGVSKSLLKRINEEVYPNFANANVQFLGVEIWDTLPDLNRQIAGYRSSVVDPSFPVVVAKDHPNTPSIRFDGTGGIVLIGKGGNIMTELFPSQFDQVNPAIAKLASGS